MPEKVAAIMAIKTPTTKKQVRSFIGIVNHYRDMWKHRSITLAPLTSLVSTKAKWKWTEEEQQAFDNMKKIISQEVLLPYPDFTKMFDIHTDASDLQIGSVISQDNQPIAFFSRKLNDAQTRYTTTEKNY